MAAISGSTAALLGTMALTTAATVGTSLYQGGQQAKAAKSAKSDAEKAAAQRRQDMLTAGEAQSASKKAFRQGVFFTSPIGDLNSGTRGRSRLLGAGAQA